MAAIGGRDEIDALYRNAANGVFTMEADTARRCAETVQTLIEGLQGVHTKSKAHLSASFGDFQSGREMQAGFETKTEALRTTLGDFIEAAERLKASFQLAGSLVAQAEDDATSNLGSIEIGSGP